MSRFILLLLLAFFFARAVWRFLEGIAAGAAAPDRAPRRPAARQAVKLVQDPVCGTFVVPGKSPSLVSAGQTIYFCSETCLEKYGRT